CSPNGSSAAPAVAGGGAGVCATTATERPNPITKAAAMGSSRFRVATIEVSLQEKYSGDLSSGLPGLSTAAGPLGVLMFGVWLAIKLAGSYNRKHGGGLRAWVY